MMIRRPAGPVADSGRQPLLLSSAVGSGTAPAGFDGAAEGKRTVNVSLASRPLPRPGGGGGVTTRTTTSYIPPQQQQRQQRTLANAPIRRDGETGSSAGAGATIYYPNSVIPDVKRWDVFRLLPQRSDGYRSNRVVCLEIGLQCLKLAAYLVSFALLLGSAVIAKGAILLITSGIGWAGKNFTLCNNPNTIGAFTNNTVIIENKHVVKWIWSLYFAVCAPEIFCFIRCVHRIFFRSVKKPSAAQFFCVLSIETLQAIGVGILLFKVLPDLTAVTGAMLGNCLSLVPALFTLLSRAGRNRCAGNSTTTKGFTLTTICVILDIASIAAQSSGFWAWPIFVPDLTLDDNYYWSVPLGVFLTSLGWWENFLDRRSIFPFVRRLSTESSRLRLVQSKTYALVSLWKCGVYFCCLCAFITTTTSSKSGRSPISIRELMEPDPFGAKPIKVIVWRPTDKVRSPSSSNITTTDDHYGDQSSSIIDPITTTTTVRPVWWPPAPPKLNKNPNEPIVIDASDFVKDPTIIDHQNQNQNATSPHRLLRRRRSVEGSIGSTSDHDHRYADRTTKIFYTTPYDAVCVALVQILAAFFCYQCAKFACKVLMQRFSFALPLNAAVPLIVALLSAGCAKRSRDQCFLADSLLPYEIFWKCHDTNHFLLAEPQTWFWAVWLLSQIWVTVHIWMPECERLADTDRLFVVPWFSGAFIDQSLSMNRRRDDKMKIKTEEVDLEGDDGANLYETIPNYTAGGGPISDSNIGARSTTTTATASTAGGGAKSADAITKIYACATMWHETSTEMICMLKSIFRLDEDQCARRNAQKYLKVIDPDYYEFESHIFFDDAFDVNEFGEPIINRFVKQFLAVIEVAASAVHETNIRLKSGKKYSTPYGGRLVWTLPGRNKLTLHLKDKVKIRVLKRWSQVMYMYYLLGHRVMEKIEDVKRKETVAENAYILTLDGDVDFKPASVHLLVDLMKKNRRLGAACGRMHPRGSGPMVWYQKFEYAIGHWFQKATEHMIGCVLCAPGCFSLFRSAALMDDDVLRKYATKSDRAKDYIQYDQGEDRWLCTLLLQRGYRVEYCAASDALTYAPEGFEEFFNQRRRWVPSTVANILDLLSSYKRVVKVNDSISVWYILYQFAMLISSVLGPGTIFLMVVGAVNISFGWETYQSLLLVLVPVALFATVCLTCKSDTQLIVAQIIGSLFALLMMAVIVGTALQIKKDGMYSPHAIFLVGIIISFFIAALLHPLEFSCIIPGVLYFLAIPCMYMLLIIYSICNLHVVTWGTREVKRASSADEGHKKSEVERKGGKLADLTSANSPETAELDGVYSVGCGSACRLICCLQPSAIGASPQMIKISQQLDDLGKKVEKLDARLAAPINRRSSLGLGLGAGPGAGIINPAAATDKLWDNQAGLMLLEEDEPIDDNFDVPYNEADEQGKIQYSESWLNDKSLRRAERDHLERDEWQFWKEMIDRYLHPLQTDRDHQQTITGQLLELRNKCAGGFFMLNALFILIVFLLQLQKNCLHVEWPLGPLVNRSIVPCDYYYGGGGGGNRGGEEIWRMTRLQLEPIGVVFLIFFVSLLLLQFVCMLLHRFGTLSHILASTRLVLPFRRKSSSVNKKLTEDELLVQNAVEIARELQAIRGVDAEDLDLDFGSSMIDVIDDDDRAISRRRVVKSLENSRRSLMRKRTETLDAAFKKRFFNLSSEEKNNKDEQKMIGTTGKNKEKVGNNGRGTKRRSTLNKGTIRALEMRRNSVFGTLDSSKNSEANGGGGGTGTNGRRRLDAVFPPTTAAAPISSSSYKNSSSDEENINNAKMRQQQQHSSSTSSENNLNARF